MWGLVNISKIRLFVGPWSWSLSAVKSQGRVLIDKKEAQAYATLLWIPGSIWTMQLCSFISALQNVCFCNLNMWPIGTFDPKCTDRENYERLYSLVVILFTLFSHKFTCTQSCIQMNLTSAKYVLIYNLCPVLCWSLLFIIILELNPECLMYLIRTFYCRQQIKGGLSIQVPQDMP